MKITLVHPYRHHTYNTVKALAKLDNDLEVYYGYYNKNNYVYNLLKKYQENKFISKFLGYNDVEIDKYVKIDIVSNILFLISKKDERKIEIFRREFQKRTLKKVGNKDIYFILQDYCNDILEYAYENNKIIIYDQITPAGEKQRKLLLREAKKYNFPISYVDKFLAEDKIQENYNNIKKANIIINASNSTYKITEDILGKEKASKSSFIIPYGTNFEHMKEDEFKEYIEYKQNNLENRKLKLLYVGSISLAKGINYLIEIIEELKDCNIEFGVVGVPNKEEDQIFIEKLNEFDNVKYYGSVPHRQINQIYKEYDMFIFTSIIEGFGMVTLEAMSMGLPCIVNEYCSSVVENKYNGFIVDDIDSKYYVDTIKHVLKDNKILRNMSYNAYNTSKKYTWNRYIDQLTTILQSSIL